MPRMPLRSCCGAAFLSSAAPDLAYPQLRVPQDVHQARARVLPLVPLLQLHPQQHVVRKPPESRHSPAACQPAQQAQTPTSIAQGGKQLDRLRLAQLPLAAFRWIPSWVKRPLQRGACTLHSGHGARWVGRTRCSDPSSVPSNGRELSLQHSQTLRTLHMEATLLVSARKLVKLIPHLRCMNIEVGLATVGHWWRMVTPRRRAAQRSTMLGRRAAHSEHGAKPRRRHMAAASQGQSTKWESCGRTERKH